MNNIRRFFNNIRKWFIANGFAGYEGQARWYSFLTITILLLLIAFQVYWVIGNQLISQLTELLQKESDVNLEIIKNQIEYDSLELIYKQKEIDTENYKKTGTFTFYETPGWERDILENLSQKEKLQAELELLKAQLERNSTMLLIWSRPWDDLLEENGSGEILIPVTGLAFPELTAADNYAVQIDSFTAQIAEIDRRLAEDPQGTNEADLLNSTLTPQLKSIEDQLGLLYAENSDLYVQETELRGQIEGIESQAETILAGGTAAVDKATSDLNAQLTSLNAQKASVDTKIGELEIQLSAASISQDAGDASNALEAQLEGLKNEQASVKAQIEKIQKQLDAISDKQNAIKELEAKLNDVVARKEFNNNQIQNLQTQSETIVAKLIPAGEIVNRWRADKQNLTDKLNAVVKQQQADVRRESSRQAQLAGQFVVVVLQSYLLPLLYGLLGASSYVLRSLSNREIDEPLQGRTQNPVRISLGALAGIMVGFLIPTDEATSFIGSLSPLALAFLVGYNIEFFFSLMDMLTNRLKDLIKGRDVDNAHAAGAQPKPEDEPGQPVPDGTENPEEGNG